MPSVHPWDGTRPARLDNTHTPLLSSSSSPTTHTQWPGSRILTIHMAVTVGKASHLAARMSRQVPPLTNRWLKAVSGSSA